MTSFFQISEECNSVAVAILADDGLVEDNAGSRGNAGAPCMPQNEIQKAKCIDRISRLIFPLIFIVFNIFYWFYFGRSSHWNI